MEAAGKATAVQITMPPRLKEGKATERLQVVAPEPWVVRLDEWRRLQAKIPSRSEAIRLLVDRGMAADPNLMRDAEAVSRELRRRERQKEKG